VEWREIDLPDLPWVPHGLSGRLRGLPSWAARAAAEARFAGEVADFTTTLAQGPHRLVADLPPGEGRGVLVIPGFGFGDAATTPLQLVLKAAGYRVFLSRIRWNVRCPDDHVSDLVPVAEECFELNGRKPLLVVGHSRGGMLGRGLAVRRPDLIGRTIAMGSPLNYEFAFYELPVPLVGAMTSVYHADPARRALQCCTPQCQCPYMRAAHSPLPDGIDLVSLYTRADGIVDWRSCVVPGATNVEVPGTHLGMGMRPATLRLVVQLLANADNRTATGT